MIRENKEIAAFDADAKISELKYLPLALQNDLFAQRCTAGEGEKKNQIKLLILNSSAEITEFILFLRRHFELIKRARRNFVHNFQQFGKEDFVLEQKIVKAVLFFAL
ncbi:hypothetical protein CEXT_60321 [Caerostris extrusa]|uniref:Uncharacterized protein n=1 Tax=Caerostris extrusa TaxID=172846 RepID=A0AAV4XNG0_CAEEX|nr:hypothetical protein CEXT_60321 [Caerostris extrusa]